MDLVLNNLQRLICHKTKPNQHDLIAGCRHKNKFRLFSKKLTEKIDK